MTVNNAHDSEELRARLSLIQNSVRRFNLHSREEFEQQLLGGASIDDTVAYHVSANSIYKTCLEVTPKNKTFLSTVQKWIVKSSRKNKLDVKFLSLNNNASPRELLDDYTRKVGGKGSQEKKKSCDNHDNPKKFMGCALQADNVPDLLSLYHPYPRGTLVQGIVQSCYNSSRASQKSFSCPSTDLFLDNHGCAHGKSNNHNKQHEAAILESAAVLYYQIWYFRTIAAKDVRKAYGFAVTSTSSKPTNRTDGDTKSPNDVALSVTLLLLEKPSTGPIGGRYPLYEYTQTYALQNSNDNDNNHHSKIWNEFGHLLLSRNLPCPFLGAANLTTSTQSPGYMLLPTYYHPQMQEEPWQVISTITGSLVIRVTGGVDWIQTLMLRGTSGGRDDGEAKDTTALITDLETMAASETQLDNHCPQEPESNNDDVWYIKFKTPAFGSFWDTSILAINGTRRILQRKWNNTAGAFAAPVHRHFVQGWLRMYPMDSHIIDTSRAITIMRSVGSPFLGPKQLSWKDFQLEFASLMTGTIFFQNLCNNLIHGDVNLGNVLYDKASRRGQRLKLIDWDEALRGRPCHRQITTEEERFRYPVELVTFPEQYTKQQFLHLFASLVQKHYLSVASHDEKWKDLRVQSKFLVPGDEQDLDNRILLSRSAVDARFKELLDTLQSDV